MYKVLCSRGISQSVRGDCQRQGALSLTIVRSRSVEFPQNSAGFGERGAMLRARCPPRPNDSSFYNLEFLSERPNYRRREGLLLLHAAADSVET